MVCAWRVYLCVGQAAAATAATSIWKGHIKMRSQCRSTSYSAIYSPLQRMAPTTSGPVVSCCSDLDLDLDKNGTWPRANCNCSCRDCQAVWGLAWMLVSAASVFFFSSRVATGHNKFCGCHAMRTRVACWMDGWSDGWLNVWMLDSAHSS